MTGSRVAEASRKAGYMVKNHGHRFFVKALKQDPETGEIYLPEEYKFVQLLDISESDPYTVICLLKDELHG